MRRYGLYDARRGLMTALAAGTAGLLLWVATEVGQQSTGRFWASMGICLSVGVVGPQLERLYLSLLRPDRGRAA